MKTFALQAKRLGETPSGGTMRGKHSWRMHSTVNRERDVQIVLPALSTRRSKVNRSSYTRDLQVRFLPCALWERNQNTAFVEVAEKKGLHRSSGKVYGMKYVQNALGNYME